MRIEPFFAPSLQLAPVGRRRTVLPFAAGPATPAPNIADPVQAGDPIARQRELSRLWPIAPKAQPAAAQPAGTPRPTNPRLESLRRGEIVKTANRGSDFLRHVSEGRLSESQAAASFALELERLDASQKTKAELKRRFSARLEETVRPSGHAKTLPTETSPVPMAFGPRALQVASQGVSGSNVGLTKAAGLPVDMVTEGLNLISRGIKEATGRDLGQIDRPFFGSEFLEDVLTDLGTITPPSDDPAGQFARRVGTAVGETLVPAAGVVGAASRLSRQAVNFASPILKQASRSPGLFLASELGVGAASGAGAAIANQIAPDSALADFAGQVLGALTGVQVAQRTVRAIREKANATTVRESMKERQDHLDLVLRHTRFKELFDGTLPGPRKRLRRNMLADEFLELWRLKDWAAHHIVPYQFRDYPLIRQLGLNINHPDNGIPLSRRGGGTSSAHEKFHKGYNNAFKVFLKRLNWSNLRVSEKRLLLAEAISDVREELWGGNIELAPDNDETWDKALRIFQKRANRARLPEGPIDD